jgi:putative transposase
MPWKEVSALEQREAFIEALEHGDDTFRQHCRVHGISYKTGYKWLKRYRLDPVMGLVDLRTTRSFKRHYSPEEIEPILILRRQRPRWGPLKLLAYLKRVHPEHQWPSEGTVKNLLRSEGLVAPRRRRNKCPVFPPERQRTEATKPNDVWCADLKGWFRTRDRSRCEPLTVLDDFSRFLLGIKHVSSRGHEESKKVFKILFKKYGRPKVIRTDNGAPFGSRGLCSLSPLSVWLITEGVYPEKIRPGHPEENGRQERFHRTLNEETAKPPAKTLLKQDQRFKAFQADYNDERPHGALEFQTPSCFYQPGQYEVNSRFEYPEGTRVVRVSTKGYLKLDTGVIYLSESLKNRDVRLEERDHGEIQIDFQGYYLGVVETEPDPHE